MAAASVQTSRMARIVKVFRRITVNIACLFERVQPLAEHCRR
jgi:hypothetical protein